MACEWALKINEKHYRSHRFEWLIHRRKCFTAPHLNDSQRFQRVQFPIILEFAKTINKSQGQTIWHTTTFFTRKIVHGVFSRGQTIELICFGRRRTDKKISYTQFLFKLILIFFISFFYFTLKIDYYFLLKFNF